MARILQYLDRNSRLFSHDKAGPVQFVHNGEIQHMALFRIKIKDCLCLVKSHKKKNGIWRTPLKHPNPTVFGCASMEPLPVGQGSKEPARGGVLGSLAPPRFFMIYEFPLPRDDPRESNKIKLDLDSGLIYGGARDLNSNQKIKKVGTGRGKETPY
jgi:hypothetical protein